MPELPCRSGAEDRGRPRTGDAVPAAARCQPYFRALATLDTAAGEAVAYALSALSSHLPRCRRSVTIDARLLLRQSDH